MTRLGGDVISMERFDACVLKNLLLVDGGITFAIVIPLAMRGKLTTSGALGFWPLVATARTNATSPEGMPRRAAARNAVPSVFRLWPVFAFRTVDLWVIPHVVPRD